MAEDIPNHEPSSPAPLSVQDSPQLDSSSSLGDGQSNVMEYSKAADNSNDQTLGQNSVPTDDAREIESKVEEAEEASPRGYDISRAHSMPVMGFQSVTQYNEPSDHQVEVAFVPSEASEATSSSNNGKQVDAGPIIDTSAPIESVREAVSKFGGINNWKTRKVQNDEKRKTLELKLEKVQEEIPEYKKQTEAAEVAKCQVLNELDNTKRLIEELKLNLERAQTEENQAKQDSELAKLRVKEMEQGIADGASVAAKAQFEVAQSRHTAAVDELKSVKNELENMRAEYSSLLVEKDLALKRAEETVSKSKEVEKTVEELTVELIATKESLESAHVAHMEAEDRLLTIAEDKELDSLNWEKELKQAEDDLQNLNQQLLSKKDLKSRLETTSTILHNLELEISACTEDESNQGHGKEGETFKTQKENELHLQETIASEKKELDRVMVNIEKATTEVNYLKVASVSLTSELERENLELSDAKEREVIASAEVTSLEAELNRMKLELALAQMKEKEAREKMADVPKSQLQEAAEEADQAKLLVLAARDELRKAKEEVELAKASLCTIETRLRATEKEIEAARASERLAIAAAKALERDSVAPTDELEGVTLPIEEYNALSKKAQEAEKQANMRVAAAISQIEIAKESELSTLEKLEEVIKEIVGKKEELRIATEKAEKAKEGKMEIEQELRKWRDENGQRRRASNAVKSPRESLDERKEPKSIDSDVSPHVQSETSSKVSANEYNTDSSSEVKVSRKKKKKPFFPRIIMYLARRKSLSPKVV